VLTPLRALAQLAPQPRVEALEPLEAELAPVPGAMPSAMAAASRRIVPPPHIGSRKGSSPRQPVRAMIPAARFSLSGASPVRVRQPRL
jgi:hypothetical protein